MANDPLRESRGAIITAAGHHLAALVTALTLSVGFHHLVAIVFFNALSLLAVSTVVMLIVSSDAPSLDKSSCELTLGAVGN